MITQSNNTGDKKMSLDEAIHQINLRKKVKEGALEKAFSEAKRIEESSKYLIRYYLEEAQKDSATPIPQKLIDDVWKAYKKHEPQRMYRALKKALSEAKKIEESSKDFMRYYLKEAQEHSATPIPQKLIDDVWKVYKEHEPQRKYRALKKALSEAKKMEESSKYLSSKYFTRYYLEEAQKHASRKVDRVILPLAELVIKAIYNLKNKKL